MGHSGRADIEIDGRSGLHQIVEESSLAGVMLIGARAFKDSRGSFHNIFATESMAALNMEFSIAQVNVAWLEATGITKGMHLQFGPWEETKFITCLEGSIFDVAVDLRADSATFGSWYGQILSGNDGFTLVIPPGCAHGVQALSPGARIHYVHSQPYKPEAEGGVHALDEDLNIAWPLTPVGLSTRDRNLPSLARYREEHH